MSIKLLAKVWTLKVSGTEREVLNAMCDHADDFGREARPSIAYIAWKVGCDERTVIRHIKKLRAKNALQLERPARDHSPNVYRVNLSVYEEKPKFEPKGDAFHDAERGDKLPSRTNERGDILTERGDKLVSPKPPLKPSNTHTQESSEIETPFQQAWQTLMTRFEKYGGVIRGATVIEDFKKVFDGNKDFPAERLANALKRLDETRSIFRAIDAYREWRLPSAPKTYSKQAPVAPPPKQRTEAEIKEYVAMIKKRNAEYAQAGAP